MYETKEDDFEIFNLRIIHRKNRTGFEENKDFPIVIYSIIGGRYYVTEFLGSAAFSKVVQAHDLHLGMDVCLKIIKNDKDFFDQSLDEIKFLKFVNKFDPADERNILRLYDYFYFQEHLFIVTELLRENLYKFQKYNQESDGEPYFTLPRLQVITRQCLEALSYLHDQGIIYCDLKPENILIKSYRKYEIKDHVSLYVQSRSYWAPEVMLGLSYDQKIDMWSLGCILAELCSGEVLFPNEGIVMLLARMIGVIGPIDIEMLRKGQETHKYFTKEYDLY
ncbi:dual specificity protein kinase pom1 [Phtheirospermum japonicum]|uniref:Dual specificity protein kinase pom1 n=1 Tax=Phtheirospermum japonicum TaxID=374723 RepID=A0A830DFV3_9LAMI|nr:dual specificity protein kinase pom1 [Phtheirospermum japonicum]